MFNADELRQTTITIVVTVVLVLGMFWGETLRRQGQYFSEAEQYMDAENYRQAITSYESALHMYTPFSGRIEQAKDRLLEIGSTYETNGDLDMALIAYRTLRSSFYATRSFYTPYEDVIAFCDNKITSIVEQQRSEAAAQTGAPGESETSPADAQAPSDADLFGE